ncbi:branched-chain amino acid ABC transporter permease [Acuticoccus sp. I52.16.1]|uniref:branched-chain amino acid ABC transporter permease n=1 Tax=Acuticoccus sp. I52.16.1 TaxID=2928472 RepID=UPI00352E5309
MSATDPAASPAIDDAVAADARRPRLAARGALVAGVILLALFAALPPVATAIGDPFLVVTATRILIFAIAALSLDLVLGFGAMVSFGHAAFLGFGAYAVAILATAGVDDVLLQMIVAVLGSGLFALVTGAISLRTKGVYFIMITLAFGQMAYFFFVSLSAYGGDDGLTLQHRSTLFGQSVFENDVAFYYLALVVLAAAFFLLRMVVASRFGRVLRGTRDNAMRMQAIGFAPFRYQLTAYVVAGALCGIAGVLLANQTEFVSPAFMTWQRSGELIVMVVLGGMGTLAGAIAGAAGYLILEEVLSSTWEHWHLVFGALIILLVLFTRGGMAGLVGRIFGGRA